MELLIWDLGNGDLLADVKNYDKESLCLFMHHDEDVCDVCQYLSYTSCLFLTLEKNRLVTSAPTCEPVRRK